jgi:phenylalanyl-tRNA synthetase beta chain
LRAKIEAVGIRSINNVVDITNFVMLELGQPLHAFDADKLHGGINVRLARDGEKFLALDGKTYSLGPENLVIADSQRSVAIAGVMGGEDTGVTESTKNVLLESAYFLPESVRRTARTLNLPSDSSYRFERGVDPDMVLRASERAATLIVEIKCGHPAKQIAAAGKLPPNPSHVSLSYSKVDQVLGLEIKPKVADGILERFGLSKSKSAKTRSTWKIPSYRRDLQRDVDLIEEVVRAHGVQKIAGTDRSRFTASSAADKAHDLETDLRLKLSARGLNEARTSKLIPRNAPAFSENAIELRNPLSEDHVALRPSLIGGLLDVLGRNVRAGAERVAIFELGRVFVPPGGNEERHIGILLWGNTTSDVHWRADQKRRLDFFDLKGAIESVIGGNSSFRRNRHPNLALASEIHVGDQFVGLAGQLSTSLASKIDAAGGVFVAEFSVDRTLSGQGSAATFREFGKFPAVTRDIAMIVPETLTHEEILNEIFREKEPLLEKVAFFDLFTGKDAEHLGPARKSLAYTLTYRDRSRTLTSEEVTAAHAKIRERLQCELGAELRE